MTYIGLFFTPEAIAQAKQTYRLGADHHLDHVTLMHAAHAQNPESVIAFYEQHKGEEFDITITHYGFNQKALAVKVDIGPVPYTTVTPHITVLCLRGGKPADSNFITNWTPLEPLTIKGRLGER